MLSLVETTYTDPDSELLEDSEFCGHQPRKISVLECVHDGVAVPGTYYDSNANKLYNTQNGTIESTSTRESSSPESERQTHQSQSGLDAIKQDDKTIPELGQTSNGMTSSSNTNHTHGIHVCPSGEKVSRTNLYIKGLPDSFCDEKLWNLPPDQTQIKSVKAATDDDGKCRGYGFIDFINEHAANEALKHIRETYPAFTIKFAKENEKDKTNLYVTHLPKSWTTKDSDQLKLVFERFGPIQSAFVMMERSTNRTTGVGFVRFANERDALTALDSIKTNPIILPECTEPVEAKFADKHNPDTRRRRYPAAASVLQTSNMNNLLGYPLTLGHPGTQVASTDPLAALLNGSLTVHHHPHHQNTAAAQRLAQGLLTTPVTGKLTNSTSANANPLAVGPDFSGLTGNPGVNGTGPDSQLNAFTAAAVAAAALLGGGPSGTNNPVRSTPGATSGPGTAGPFNPLQLNTANLFTTAPLSMITNPTISMATGPAAGTDPALIDPSLYGCSLYGTDYYRQTQQQQQQLAAAVAAMNNVTPSASLYSPVPDLTQFIGYPNGLLGSHPGAASVTGTTCLAPTGANLGPVYSAQASGLLPAPNSALTDPLGLVGGSRPTAAVHSWLLPNPLLKTGSTDPAVPIAQATVLPSNPSGVSGFGRNCKHVQLFI